MFNNFNPLAPKQETGRNGRESEMGYPVSRIPDIKGNPDAPNKEILDSVKNDGNDNRDKVKSLSELWDNDSASQQDTPIFEQKELQEAMGKVDFSKAVDQEKVAKMFEEKDAAAFTSILNDVVKMATNISLHGAGAAGEKARSSATTRVSSEVKLVKDIADVEDQIHAHNSSYMTGARAEMVSRMAKRYLSANPKASPSEAAKEVINFLGIEKKAAAQEDTGSIDWKDF